MGLYLRAVNHAIGPPQNRENYAPFHCQMWPDHCRRDVEDHLPVAALPFRAKSVPTE